MSQMDSVSTTFRESLSGSRQVSVRCDVWRGGMIVAEDVPVTDGTVTVTDGQAIRTQVSLTIADPDGKLRPLADDAAIAPYGSELNIRAGVVLPNGGVESVSLGWFPITDVGVTEEWVAYDRPGEAKQTLVPTGGSLSISAADRAQLIADARFEAREQPKASTALKEIARLVSGIVAFRPPDIEDRAVPSSITYDDDRLAAVAALAGVLDCDPVFSPAGALELWPRGIGDPVWTVSGGAQGVLVKVDRSLSRTAVYNAAIVTGAEQETDGTPLAPLVGRAYLTDGPLVYGGPFGRVPYFQASQILAKQSSLDRAAETLLRTLQTRRAQVLQIVCAPNPTITAGDTVTLVRPRGQLACRITSMTYPLTPGSMKLTATADPTVIGRVS